MERGNTAYIPCAKRTLCLLSMAAKLTQPGLYGSTAILAVRPVGILPAGFGLPRQNGQDARLPHRREPMLQGNQLQPGLHFCRHTIAMIKTSADRRDIRRPQSNGRRDEVIIAKDAIGRV
jgi:hypothetical protein